MAIDIPKLLGDSLLDLCQTKSLSSITIQNLLDDTGISRQTFYNYFHDKNDLIQWTYEYRVLSGFLNNGPESTYYRNTLGYYQAIDSHRNFMKQAVLLKGQNNLQDFIYDFAFHYDLKWHQHFLGQQIMSEEFIFITKYHSIASSNVAMDWITSSSPAPAEEMARRITMMRKISMSDYLFGENAPLYQFD